MLNIEKYANKIREKLEINSIIAAVNELNDKTCLDCETGDCVSCEIKAFDWLLEEAQKDCGDCKHSREIKSEDDYFVCMYGKCVFKKDKIPCTIWEENNEK